LNRGSDWLRVERNAYRSSTVTLHRKLAHPLATRLRFSQTWIDHLLAGLARDLNSNRNQLLRK
jgi:hypothetical protein